MTLSSFYKVFILTLIVTPSCFAYFGQDFSRLTVAVDNVLNSNHYLARELAASVKIFEQNLRREIQQLTPSFSSGFNQEFGKPSFDSPQDFFLHRKFQSDYVSNPLGVDKVELINEKWLNETVIGFDVIEINYETYLLLLFTRSIVLYPRFSINFKPRVDLISLKGLISAKLITYENDLYIFLLWEDDDEERYVSSYKWNSDLNLIEHGVKSNSKVKVDKSSKKLLRFNVPVTGSDIIGVLGKFELVVYTLEQQEGQLAMRRCDELVISDYSDVTSFSINGQLYVGVANGRYKMSHLWKYRPTSLDFIFHQTFAVENASSILHISRSFQHFLLLSENLYQWDGERFFLKQHLQTLKRSPIVLKYYDTYGTDVVILPQNIVWKGNKFIQSSSLVLDSVEPFSHWVALPSRGNNVILTATGARIAVYRVIISRDAAHSMSDDFDKTLSELESKLQQREQLVSDTSRFLEDEERRQLTDVVVTDNEKCRKLRERIDHIHTRLPRINARMDDFQQVQRNWSGLELVVVDGTLSIEGHLQTDTINAVNVTEFFKDAVKKQGKGRITGRKTFVGKSSVEGTCKVGTWNRRRVPEDYVITTIPQHVKSNWRFLSNVTVSGDVEVKRHLNSIDVSRDVVLTNTTEAQHVKGPVVFSNDLSVTEEVSTGGLVNGINVSRLAAVVTSKGDHVYRGPKTLNRLKVRGNVNVESVSGLDLKKLARDAVYMGQESVILGHKVVLGNVHVDGQLTVDTINDLRLPEDFVTVGDGRPVHVEGLKRFANELTIDGNLEVEGRLSGVDLNEVLTTREQQQDACGGEKTFLDIVTGDVYLSDREAVQQDEVLVNGKLVVKNSVNGVDLKKYYQDVIHKNASSNVTFLNKVTFTQPQVFSGRVELTGTVNGFNFDTDFVRLDRMNVVRAMKWFNSPVTIGGDIRVSGNVAGIDIDHLERNLVRANGNVEVISGVKTFVDGLSVGQLKIDEEDADSSTVLPFGNRRLLVNRCSMKEDVFVRGSVNDQPFEEIANNRITLSSEQELHSSLSLDSSSVVNRLMAKGRLNNVDIDNLWGDVLWSNVDTRRQVITGKKVFDGELVTPAVFTRDGVNGINLKNHANRAVYVHKNRFIDVPVLTMNEIDVNGDGLIVRGTVNDYNITNVFEEAVSLTDVNSATIKGVKTFNTLSIKGSVWVREHLNGLRPNEDLLTTNTRQNVTGNLTFCSEVRASNVVVVDHLIKKINRKQEELRLEGNVTTDTLWSGGDVNGMDVASIYKDAVKRFDHETISGVKTFTGNVTFKRDLNINEHINGYDYLEHLKRIVTTRGNWTVTGPKIFTGEVVMTGDVNVDADLLSSGLINAVDVNKEQIVEGKVVIDGPFHVVGNVTVLKTLTSGQGKMAQIVTGSVNGLNLKEVMLDTLLSTDSKQNVTGYKTIDGPPGLKNASLPEWITFQGKVTFAEGLNLTNTCPVNVKI